MNISEAGAGAARRTPSRRVAAVASATFVVLVLVAAVPSFRGAVPALMVGASASVIVALAFAVRSAPRPSPRQR